MKPLHVLGLGAGLFVGLRWARRLRARRRLRGATVLLTGGSRGLGLALARRLGARGARLVLCARDRETLERARESLEARGVEVLRVLPCDLTDPDQVRTMLARTAELGPVDVLVHDAGTMAGGPFEAMTDDDWAQAWALHVDAPRRLVEGLRPTLSQVVLIASVGGRIPVPHMLPYVASKFGLVGLGRGLHAELASHGIDVLTVSPGLMRTGSPRHARFKGHHTAEHAWFAAGGWAPGVAMPAARAARRIVRAMEEGRAEIVLGLPATLAVRLHDVSPALFQRLAALAARALPTMGGIGRAGLPGHASSSGHLPGMRRVQRRLHQVPPTT